MAHAFLSPSAAARWTVCTRSVTMVPSVPESDEGSVYAREGTEAHRLAEIKAAVEFDLVTPEEGRKMFAEWSEAIGPDWIAEMGPYTTDYVNFLRSLEPDRVFLEQRLDTGIPRCWGTSDAVLLSGHDLHVVDFKYGRGVSVEVERNPQLMLYGVGALDMVELLYAEVASVYLHIHQPRIDHIDSWYISPGELREWRDSLLPIAAEALAGTGEFVPTESACRWCPVRGECKARADSILAEDFGDPDLLDPDDLSAALTRAPEIRQWLKDLEEVSLTKTYEHGETIPGWKVVRSGGRRRIVDHAAALQRLYQIGRTVDEVARVECRPLGELQKVLKDDMSLLDDFIHRSDGKPSLVPETDPREAIDSAHDDFRDQP